MVITSKVAILINILIVVVVLIMVLIIILDVDNLDEQDVVVIVRFVNCEEIEDSVIVVD